MMHADTYTLSAGCHPVFHSSQYAKPQRQFCPCPLVSKKLRESSYWRRASCLVVSVRVQRDASASNLYRSEVVVRDYGLSDPNEQIVANFGERPSYVQSAQLARRALAGITPGLRRPCWVRSSNRRQVSIVHVSRTREESEDLYLNMAWGSSFFAAISGFLLLAFIANFVNRAAARVIDDYEDIPLDEQMRNGERQRKRDACLTQQQAKFVCAALGKSYDAKEQQLELHGWTCSICLEENAVCERVKVVTLPCEHQYHMR